jgi:hypothetical protein
MCPLCLSTAVWLAIGSGPAVSFALILGSLRKKGHNDGDDDDAPDRNA